MVSNGLSGERVAQYCCVTLLVTDTPVFSFKRL